MASNCSWLHQANAARRLKNAAEGKTLRVRDGRGRRRGRQAWNQRRALARAEARLLKASLAARGGQRRRMQGKQPPFACRSSEARAIADKALKPSSAKPLRRLRGKQGPPLASCSSSSGMGILAWPSDIAVCASTCAPQVTPSPSPSNEEPLDDAMFELVEACLAKDTARDQKHLERSHFRLLALHAGVSFA